MVIRHHRSTRLLCLSLGFALVLVSGQVRAEVPQPPAAQPSVTPQPQDDRSQKSGGANAAAAAGAATAMATCAMMMMMAQKEEDESTKNMMQMMALQECAQGAQSLASAGQNDKGKNTLKQSDGLKQAAIASPFPSPSTSPSPSTDLSKLFPTNNDDGNKVAENSPSPEPSAPREKEAPTESPDPGDGKKFELPKTTLAPIDMQKLKFNDSNRVEANSAPSGSGPGSPSLGNGKNAKGELAADGGVAPTFGSDGSAGSPGRKRTKSEGDPSGGGGDSGTEKSGEKDPFESMLSQLMAPKSPFDSMPQFGGGGSDYFGPQTAGPAKSKVTLFQYATLIYKKRAYREKKLVFQRKGKNLTVSKALNGVLPGLPGLKPAAGPAPIRTLAGVLSK